MGRTVLRILDFLPKCNWKPWKILSMGVVTYYMIFKNCSGNIMENIRKLWKKFWKLWKIWKRSR